MNIPLAATADELRRGRAVPGVYPALAQSPRPPASAVSWGAILAGAAAAAALSLILLILGTGLGLSSVSPWAHDGTSATTFGASTIAWLTFTQLAASAMGGYLAGRLRTKWVAVHTDEVYFRDTAHGFLAWAISALATAALLTSVIGSIVGTGARAGASMAGTAATGLTAATTGAGGAAMGGSDNDHGPTQYLVNSLFRRDANAAAAPTAMTGTSPTGAVQPAGEMPMSAMPARPESAPPTAEVAGIFMNSLRTGALPQEDSRYVAQVVAQRTGLTQQDALKRVNDTYARMQLKMNDAQMAAKDAAAKARKASAYAALWLFVSLLIGAFAASLAATYGGRRRDL
ncbi:hypothetical protein [Rhodoferax sediminis]|uniref:Transmembrane protein n=1 Tax=Rhodoferax sediminis TaxID=2509614 RepID=A0A515D8N7_9BURK|nr:hypothetical protein [Rhodoferax sediminis]QDL36764.1 hypothetical protein EUB48_05210 [Rhodoferax sediminis]